MDLDDAALDDGLDLGAHVRGQAHGQLAVVVSVLFDVLVVVRKPFFAARLEAQVPVEDLDVDRRRRRARYVEHHQVGVVALEQIEEDVVRQIPQRVP